MTDRKFRVGERVRVDERYPEGHVRTPFYIRGKVGTIADAVGAFPDPEMAALGQQPVLRELYRVRFQQSETWDGYRGATQDSLDVEIYEHWLASIGGASA